MSKQKWIKGAALAAMVLGTVPSQGAAQSWGYNNFDLLPRNVYGPYFPHALKLVQKSRNIDQCLQKMGRRGMLGIEKNVLRAFTSATLASTIANSPNLRGNFAVSGANLARNAPGVIATGALRPGNSNGRAVSRQAARNFGHSVCRAASSSSYYSDIGAWQRWIKSMRNVFDRSFQ